MALILLSPALALVSIYAAAFFAGEVALLQSQGAQMIIGGLFLVAVAFAAGGFARRIRPVAASDANDPSIVRRRIDAHHRYWRLLLASSLPTPLTIAYTGRALGALGHAHFPLSIAVGATMIAVILVPALLVIAGPGWFNRELRAILNDDFVRQLRARTARFGYITIMLSVSAGMLTALWRPDLAFETLLWSLCAGSALPALYYVIADWRAGRDAD